MKRKSSLPVLDSYPIFALVIDALLVISSPLLFAIGTWYLTKDWLYILFHHLYWPHEHNFIDNDIHIGLLFYILTLTSKYVVAKRHLIKQQWIAEIIIASSIILLFTALLLREV